MENAEKAFFKKKFLHTLKAAAEKQHMCLKQADVFDVRPRESNAKYRFCGLFTLHSSENGLFGTPLSLDQEFPKCSGKYEEGDHSDPVRLKKKNQKPFD